jgi:hypothetical protein
MEAEMSEPTTLTVEKLFELAEWLKDVQVNEPIILKVKPYYLMTQDGVIYAGDVRSLYEKDGETIVKLKNDKEYILLENN